jgi:sugar phosphate isomerase/epimerase
MFLGYNTNGFAHHRLADALEIIADLGYGGAAITLDVHHLDPFALDAEEQYQRAVELCDDLELQTVIETGARFLLDSRRKHQPTLIDPDPDEREIRSNFLKLAVDVASAFASDAVSFWSGSIDAEGDRMGRLVEECQRLADYAGERGVRLAFEPEPGMFIDTMPKFAELHEKVNRSNFGLTLDLGHLVCQGELPIGRHIRQWKDWLWNVHIEDMKAGIHDHLMFGEGELDFADAFAALKEIDYQGGVFVELSRHSYDAVTAARTSMEFLKRFLP